MRGAVLDDYAEMRPPIGGWMILVHLATVALFAAGAALCVYWLSTAVFVSWFFGIPFLGLMMLVPALLCVAGAVAVAWRLAQRLVERI